MNRRAFLRVLACVVAALPLAVCAASGILHEEQSPYGPIIVTDDGNGVRTLLFQKHGARQTVIDLRRPDHLELAYTRTALAGLALCEAPRRVLILGLGGGALPGFLRRHFPQATIDVAELNPRVLAMAKEFFGFREDDRMRVHLGDGREFIEKQPAGSYDVIVLDAFGVDSVPPHLATQEFLVSVRRTTAPTGVVIANVWQRSVNPLYDAMRRTYQEVFEDLYILDVIGDVNAIFLAFPQQRAVTESDLVQRARAVSKANGFGFDLAAEVTNRFQQAREKDLAARVLRDRR